MCPKLSLQEIKTITNDFYSHFCGTNISEATLGIHFVSSVERDLKLQAYGCKYTIYVLIKGDVCIVSYSPKYSPFFDKLRTCRIEEIIETVTQEFRIKKCQLMTFTYELIKDYGDARILTIADYPLFESFFRMNKPNANPDGWLQEYFVEKASKGYFTGYIVNNSLVAVCDAPDMPFMEDRIQHTGIQTLQNERRKGYAKCTAALATHHLIENGICPQWECNANNIASFNLAKSIGYQQYGTAYILEE